MIITSALKEGVTNIYGAPAAKKSKSSQTISLKFMA